MIPIKESRFNIYYDTDDGNRLAFNSYTCGLAVIDESYEKLLSILHNINKNNIPDELKEVYDAAKEGSFIVDDDFDELLNLSTKRNFQKYSTESMGLTIAPTLACNFKCIYCYETSKPGIMSKDTQDNIVRFIKLQTGHIKDLSISWYGGEPLLANDVIFDLSERVMDICQKANINYGAFIISNGVLLNDEIIEKLIKYNVYGIQITIDGPPEIHDHRRINKKGESTFDTIVNNINKILKTDKMDVIIRINVDKTNEDKISDLLEILGKRLINKNIKISFGQVTAYTEACRSIESNCYNNGEFAVNLLKYYEAIKKHGFAENNPFPYPTPKLNYCCADLINSFVVDPDGYLYKCWNEVGNTKNAVGNINDEEFEITCSKNGYWMLPNPVYNEKCTDCKLLPVCMGGCPHNTLVLKKKNECDLIKYNIKDVMLKYYNESK